MLGQSPEAEFEADIIKDVERRWTRVIPGLLSDARSALPEHQKWLSRDWSEAMTNIGSMLPSRSIEAALVLLAPEQLRAVHSAIQELELAVTALASTKGMDVGDEKRVDASSRIAMEFFRVEQILWPAVSRERERETREVLSQPVTRREFLDSQQDQARRFSAFAEDSNRRVDLLLDSLEQRFKEAEAARAQAASERAALVAQDLYASLKQDATSTTQRVEGDLQRALSAANVLVQSVQASAASTQQEARAHLAQMEQAVQDAKRLLQATSQIATSNGYTSAANSARSAKNYWRIIAVISLAILMWYAADHLREADSVTPTWPVVLSLALRSLPFVLLAGYAGREASRDAKREESLRDQELRLLAIGPFLAEHPVEQRHAVMLEFARTALVQVRASSEQEQGVPATERLVAAALETAKSIPKVS